MKIHNPATGEVIREIEEDRKATIRDEFDLLSAGRRRWRDIPLGDRISCLARFGELLETNKESLARTLTLETGKPIRESRSEVSGAFSKIRFFVENSENWLKPEPVNHAGGTREVIAYEPIGVIANISAWNYPYLVAMNVIPPALIAGNAVLYKPSEYATLTGLEIERLLHKAGVPEDAFRAVVGGAKTGRAILELPLDGYFFTGSYATGRSIASALAGRLVPLTLELGGKDPLYVTEDVDVPRAAANAVEGSFSNCGQSCCAVERIYVRREIYEPFVEVFVRGTKRLKMGDPLDESTTLGPVTRQAQLPYLARQVKDAVDRGATLLTGGRPVKGNGNFFEPTVLADANHSMRLMKEETFGPVIGIQKVADDDEALRLMADTDYGLTAAVFSKDESRAKAILENLDVGTGYWNCCDRVSPYLPWSGRKHSGLGTTLSHLGIRAFARPKGYHLRGS